MTSMINKKCSNENDKAIKIITLNKTKDLEHRLLFFNDNIQDTKLWTLEKSWL